MKEFYKEHKEVIKKVFDIAFWVSIGILILLFVLSGIGVIK